MAIGNIGSLITFHVNTDQNGNPDILTFDKLQKKVSSRNTTHSLIGRKPKLEFLGPDLDTISFNIVLSAMHGVRPRKTIEAIEKAIADGNVYTFVVGGKKIGSNKWLITNMSESWDKVYNRGELVQATVSISLKEYV